MRRERRSDGATKPRRGWIALAALATIALASCPALAQSGGGYVIKKSTIDGGGGKATGSGYVLTGIAGQHEAGDPTSTGYVLTGGFWSPSPFGACSSAAPCGNEPGGIAKNRFISFVGSNPNLETAIRVTITAMPLPFGGFVGAQYWVGPPSPVTEVAGSSMSTPPPTFNMARLRCTPHCMDWSTVGLVHVSDDEIIPGATYDVQAVNCACDTNNPVNLSSPLSILSAARCGDVVPIFGTVDFIDIGAVVDKFKNLPSAVIKARADLVGDVVNRVIDFNDIGRAVDSFRGIPCTWAGPCLCPGPCP